MDSGYCEFGVVLKEILNGRDQKDLARESGLADTIISLMMSGDSARLTRRNVLKCIKGLAKLRAIELDREKPHQANKLLQTASKSRAESSKDKKPFDRVELDEYSPVDKEVLEFIDRERQAFEQEQRAQDYLIPNCVQNDKNKRRKVAFLRGLMVSRCLFFERRLVSQPKEGC